MILAEHFKSLARQFTNLCENFLFLIFFVIFGNNETVQQPSFRLSDLLLLLSVKFKIYLFEVLNSSKNYYYLLPPCDLLLLILQRNYQLFWA